MNQFELLGADKIDSIRWPSWQAVHKSWLEPFVAKPSNQFIKNIRTDFRLLRLGDSVMPVTINNEEFDNSYVCSPYTAYVSYAKEELQKLRSPLLIMPLKVLLLGMGHLMKAADINRVVHCNNWLLSTNLYDDINFDTIPEMTAKLVQRFPQHCILFRSLNNFSNADLIQKLKDAGYVLIPSRQVYIFDRNRGDYLKRPNVKWDLKLIEKSNFTLVNHLEIKVADYARIVELYNALYLEKYSYHNPQFTPQFIELCHRNKLMTMYGLRDESGTLQGVVGYFQRAGIMTTPLVGYNTSLPQKFGLYRMLIALVLRDAAEENITLNLSSGAAGFKRLRGGRPEIEYSAAYTKHLSFKRRMFINVMRALLAGIGVPLMKIFKL